MGNSTLCNLQIVLIFGIRFGLQLTYINQVSVPVSQMKLQTFLYIIQKTKFKNLN